LSSDVGLLACVETGTEPSRRPVAHQNYPLIYQMQPEIDFKSQRAYHSYL